jgi:hypothetical protein
LRALSRLGGRAFYETIDPATFYEVIKLSVVQKTANEAYRREKKS